MTSGSPIARVLSRVPDAKKTARGWQARCPAHDDRGPSLSIGIGRDDRVLLRCFAGCEAVDVARALGLELRDLFDGDDARARADADASAQRRRYDREPKKTLKAFIAEQTEIARAERVARNLFDTSLLRSRDVNVARARAALVFDVQLVAIERFAWEGYAPHDCDPAWPTLFARAVDELAYELAHHRDPVAAPWVTCDPPHFIFPLAADRAARWLHGLPTTVGPRNFD